MHNPHKLFLKDYITLSISCLALIITVVSFYVTYLEIDNRATATVLSYQEDADTVTIELAYVNLGNRQILITYPDLSLTNQMVEGSYNSGYDLSLYNNQPPIILNPNEIKSAKVKFSTQAISKSYNYGKSELIYYGLEYHCICSDGNRHDATSKIMSSFPARLSARRTFKMAESFPQTYIVGEKQ